MTPPGFCGGDPTPLRYHSQSFLHHRKKSPNRLPVVPCVEWSAWKFGIYVYLCDLPLAFDNIRSSPPKLEIAPIIVSSD